VPDKKLPTTVFGAKDIYRPAVKEEHEAVPILDTKQLATAIHTAVKANFSRKVDPFVANQLDPDGWHVVGFQMVHEYGMTRPVARCQILCKMKASTQERHLWLDIDLDVFNRYQRITEAELKEGRQLGRF
jgi:hypothetical protein